MNSQINKQFLTISDVSEFLNISPSAAYELVKRRDFPSCRLGGSIRVPKDAFLAWIKMKTSISPQLKSFMASPVEVF